MSRVSYLLEEIIGTQKRSNELLREILTILVFLKKDELEKQIKEDKNE